MAMNNPVQTKGCGHRCCRRCLLESFNRYYYLFHPYETSSAAAALQNDFKKRYKRAVKGLAAAVANFGCFALHWKALCQR